MEEWVKLPLQHQPDSCILIDCHHPIFSFLSRKRHAFHLWTFVRRTRTGKWLPTLCQLVLIFLRQNRPSERERSQKHSSMLDIVHETFQRGHFPDWKISERANSFWLWEISAQRFIWSQNISPHLFWKVFLHFLLGSTQTVWVRGLSHALDGCHQNRTAYRSAALCRQWQRSPDVGWPTLQPWSPRGFTWTWARNEGKPQPEEPPSYNTT